MRAMPTKHSCPADFITGRDMEDLVSAMEDTLKVSGLQSKPSRVTFAPLKMPLKKTCRVRAAPYKIPVVRKMNFQPSMDDPYEQLQKLIRDGGLVQEAVRRVQLGLSPKQRYFYESEDDLDSDPSPPLTESLDTSARKSINVSSKPNN